jgi:hypothetical protein
MVIGACSSVATWQTQLNGLAILHLVMNMLQHLKTKRTWAAEFIIAGPSATSVNNQMQTHTQRQRQKKRNRKRQMTRKEVEEQEEEEEEEEEHAVGEYKVGIVDSCAAF